MRRHAYTIASEILQTALPGVNKNHLKYSCNLGQKRGEEYIKLLLKNGLLEKKGNRFHTTKKGIQFIETYQEIERLWNNNVIPKFVQRARINKKKRLGFAFSLA